MNQSQNRIKKSSKKPQALLIDSSLVAPESQEFETNKGRTSIELGSTKNFNSKQTQQKQQEGHRGSYRKALNQHIMSRGLLQRKTIRQQNLMKKIGRNKYPIVSHNLSQIKEAESEDVATSSENSYITVDMQDNNSENTFEDFSEDSIDDILHDENSKDHLKLFQEDDHDQLNKTMLKSRRKNQKRTITQVDQQTLQTRENKRQINFDNLSSAVEIKTLKQLMKKGQISGKQYVQVFEQNIALSKKKKQDKFQENMKLQQGKAEIIYKNYQRFFGKLNKNLETIRMKIKKSICMLKQSREKYREFSQSQLDPEFLKQQIRLYELIAEEKVKCECLQSIRKLIHEFQQGFHEHVKRIQNQKKQKQNVSENLVIKQLTNFLKKCQVNYNSFIHSFKKDERTGLSKVQINARTYYFEKLESVFEKQMKRMTESIQIDVQKKGFQMMQKGHALTEEKFKLLLEQATLKSIQRLDRIKQRLIQNTIWIRMIQQKGELKEGNQMRQIVQWIISNIKQAETSSNRNDEVIVKAYAFFKGTINQKIKKKIERVVKIQEWLMLSKNRKIMENKKSQRQQTEKQLKQLQNKISKITNRLTWKRIHVDLKQKQKYSSQNIRSSLEYYLKEVEKNRNEVQIISEQIEGILSAKQSQNKIKEPKGRIFLPKNKVVTIQFNQIGVKSIILSGKKQSPNKKYLGSDKLNHRPTDTLLDSKKANERIQNDVDHQREKSMLKEQLEYLTKKNSFNHRSETKDEKITDEEKNNYMKKVSELIAKGQILQHTKNYYQRNSEENYTSPNIWDEDEQIDQIIDQVQLTNYKASCQTNFTLHDIQYLQSLSPSKSKLQDQRWSSMASQFSNDSMKTFFFTKKLTPHQIQQVCEQFTKQFYTDKSISQKLSQEHIRFLMQPEYRKQIIEDKKKKDELEKKLIELARMNTVNVKYLQKLDNKLTYDQRKNQLVYGITIDPTFQQKVQQYQKLIVKNQETHLRNYEKVKIIEETLISQNHIYHSNLSQLTIQPFYKGFQSEKCPKSYEFEMLDRRLNEFKAREFEHQFHRYLKKDSTDTVDTVY